jgi:hypothetical protein
MTLGHAAVGDEADQRHHRPLEFEQMQPHIHARGLIEQSQLVFGRQRRAVETDQMAPQRHGAPGVPRGRRLLQDAPGPAPHRPHGAPQCNHRPQRHRHDTDQSDDDRGDDKRGKLRRQRLRREAQVQTDIGHHDGDQAEPERAGMAWLQQRRDEDQRQEPYLARGRMKIGHRGGHDRADRWGQKQQQSRQARCPRRIAHHEGADHAQHHAEGELRDRTARKIGHRHQNGHRQSDRQRASRRQQQTQETRIHGRQAIPQQRQRAAKRASKLVGAAARWRGVPASECGEALGRNSHEERITFYCR